MRKVLLAITLAGIGYVAVAAQGPSQKEPFGPSLNAVVSLEQVPGRPVRNRELAKVVFPHPVKVLNAWLLGDYLIEHDTDRMERGEPCTHIYRFNDRRRPVVTFFCEHLHRDVAERGTVKLRSVGIASAEFELLEFQFQGSAEGHGVPNNR